MANSVQLLEVSYAQTGQSIIENNMGMREMQARAFEKRDAQYLLIKSPPASGKSRALMYLALEKLKNQGVRKAIVAVPEMSIGGSFESTELSKGGFPSDWKVEPKNDLCSGDNEAGKVDAFVAFMEHPEYKTLVCTHATLRFAYDRLGASAFQDCLIGVDEFHHVSADEDSKLGALIDGVMRYSNAHIVAMTGSYFRGDTVPILTPEDEEKFEKVTYTYYEQLNGYKYLKSLGIGYHFYEDNYVKALPDVLDEQKKTIIHIPNVNSGEAYIPKGMAVDSIIGCLGEEIGRDEKTGIITMKTKAGRIIKMADLVDDNKIMRPKTQAYLRAIKKPEEMDIIVALGMAKEGFDWIYCEHVLTIGFRNSMTEVVQIIGRATRDCEGKTHAQFTNLIAMPDAKREDVSQSVNNLLKAITLSLLMEQVMAPNVQFKRRSDLKEDEMILPGTVIIDDRTVPVNKKLVDILNQDADSIIAQLAEKPEVKQVITASANPEILGQLALPEILVSRYPDLSVEERDQLQQGILTRFTITQHGGLIQGKDIPADAVIEGERTFTQIEGKWVAIDTLCAEQVQALPAEALMRERDLPADATVVGTSTGAPAGGAGSSWGTGNDPADQFGNKQFIKMGNKFIDVVNLPIDLIKSVNPFERAYEILSKNVTTDVLKTIQNVVAASRVQITEEEVLMIWEQVLIFRKTHGRDPNINTDDPIEKRYAEAMVFMKNYASRKKAEQMKANAAQASGA